MRLNGIMSRAIGGFNEALFFGGNRKKRKKKLLRDQKDAAVLGSNGASMIGPSTKHFKAKTTTPNMNLIIIHFAGL